MIDTVVLVRRPWVTQEAHVFCAGMTRSGKTTWARNQASAWPGPALFINTQAEPTGRGWVAAAPHNSQRLLMTVLRDGGRIDYIPTNDDPRARMEVSVIVDGLFHRIWKPALLLVVDEAYVFAPRSALGGPVHKIACRGLRHGIHGLFLSQRAAMTAFTPITQCLAHVVFRTLPFEDGYFKSHGLPGSEIRRVIERAEKHSYVVWFDGRLWGPFKEILRR